MWPYGYSTFPIFFYSSDKVSLITSTFNNGAILKSQVEINSSSERSLMNKLEWALETDAVII